MSQDPSTLSDEDRRLLRDSVRDFLASRWPAEKAVERAGDTAALAAVWRDMGTQGLSALGADPSQGGLREISLVFEELGRASCPAPLLGAIAANLALGGNANASKSDVAKKLLADLAEGKASVAVAFGPFDGDAAAGRVEASGGSLTGRVAFVENAAGATHFLVFTDKPAGAAIVAAGAKGLSVKETPGIPVPPLSELTLEKTPAAIVEVDAQALRDVALVARVACAARAFGAAGRVFELAVEHAKVRKQFGQLIGSFQAIQHKLANCLICVEGTQLTLAQAAEAHDRSDPNWRTFASVALAFAGPNLREVSIQSHRALGAIGYAEEHEAPRHFRRIHGDVARFGGTPRARGELADYLLGQAQR